PLMPFIISYLNCPPPPTISSLSLHVALPILLGGHPLREAALRLRLRAGGHDDVVDLARGLVAKAAMLRKLRQPREPFAEGAPATDEPLLDDRVHRLHHPVEDGAGVEADTEDDDRQRQEVHHHVHHLLLRIGDLLVPRPHHAGLRELEDTGEHGQQVDRIRVTERGQPEEAVCPFAGVALRHVANTEVDAEEDRHLDQHRQTTGHRVDAVLLIKRHLLGRGRLAVGAVLLLDLLDLWSQLLHGFGGPGALDGERQEERLDNDREGDDREAATMEEGGELVERPFYEVDVLIPDRDSWGKRGERSGELISPDEIEKHEDWPPPARRGMRLFSATGWSRALSVPGLRARGGGTPLRLHPG